MTDNANERFSRPARGAILRAARGRALRLFLAATAATAATIFLFSAGVSYADEIFLNDNRRIEGKIQEETDDLVKIRTKQGEITLPKSRVKSITRESRVQAEAQGDLSEMRGDYARALESYRQALKENPSSKSLEEKIRKIEILMTDKDSQAKRALRDQAVAEIAKGEREKARGLLERIVKESEPASQIELEARRIIAYSYVLDNVAYRDKVENQRAIQALEKAIEADPGLAVAQLERAHLLRLYTTNVEATLEAFRKGLEEGERYLAQDESVRDRYLAYEPAVARFDENRFHRYQYEYGEMSFSWGKRQEAAQLFLGLLKSDLKVFSKAESDRIIKYVVDAYTDTSLGPQFDRATLHRQLDTALQLDPSVARGWFFKGRLYMDDGRSSEALAMFSKAIEVGQNVPDLHLSRAKAYLALHELDAARRDLEKELTIQDSYKVRCMLADVLLNGSAYEPALQHLTKAMEMDSSQLLAPVLRARAYRLQAMTSGVSQALKDQLLANAAQDLQLVCARNPKFREAVLELGRVYRDAKLSVEAERYLTQVIDEMKSQTTLTLTVDDKEVLAQAYVDRGNIRLDNESRNSAEEDFRNALEVQPTCAMAFNRLGLVAEKQTDFEKARENYVKAIEIDSKTPKYEFDLAWLCHMFLKDYAAAIAHYKAFKAKGGVELKIDDYIRQCETALKAK